MPKSKTYKGKRRSSRPMRLPNGFGSIIFLGSGRRRPYAAKTPTTGYTEDGYPLRQVIGYYETWDEAYEALNNYKKHPYDIDARQLTFTEVFEMWKKKKYENPNRIYSRSNQDVFMAAYKKSAPIHDKVFSTLKTVELQALMDDLAKQYKHASLEHVKSLWNQMYKLAAEYDITEKNYASFVQINRPDDDEHGVPFTRAELDRFWEMVTTVPNMDMVLVMCYSGFRIKEYESLEVDLEADTFAGGVKTAASKNRVVPIHHRIRSLVEKLLQDGRLFGVTVQINRKIFAQVMAAAEIQQHHTPHDCRHTLATQLSSAGAPELAIKHILGHSVGNDVTNKIYIHKDIEQLRRAIEMVP